MKTSLDIREALEKAKREVQALCRHLQAGGNGGHFDLAGYFDTVCSASGQVPVFKSEVIAYLLNRTAGRTICSWLAIPEFDVMAHGCLAFPPSASLGATADGETWKPPGQGHCSGPEHLVGASGRCDTSFLKRLKNRFIRLCFGSQRQQPQKNIVRTFLAATGSLRIRRMKWC